MWGLPSRRGRSRPRLQQLKLIIANGRQIAIRDSAALRRVAAGLSTESSTPARVIEEIDLERALDSTLAGAEHNTCRFTGNAATLSVPPSIARTQEAALKSFRRKAVDLDQAVTERNALILTQPTQETAVMLKDSGTCG